MPGIGQDKLNALIKHYKVNGITPRQHGNAKRLPSNTLKMEDNTFDAHFLLNYIETHGMHLPGRVPGYWRADLKLLPTNCTKRRVYDDYCTTIAVTNHRTVSLVTFHRLWREIVPFIVTMRPATDLCWFCQKYQQKISEAANKSDEEKAKLHDIASEHLGCVSKERAFYQDICKKTKDTLPAGTDIGRHDPCSYDGVMHYTMDFAQQVHYPSNPLQPGPVYFKTPRKCAIFSVACEALPKQVTFLIDESVHSGKGVNCVISLLHSYHDKYGMGETHMHLHAENCAGQNKNSYVMWYLLWFVLISRHVSITMSFLLTGHTKFSVDWCFELMKRTFRRTKVDCLEDIVKVVTDSSTAGVNVPCLVGQEDGTVLVPMHDWATFLSSFFKKVQGIKSHHHFYFEADTTGVAMRDFCDTASSYHNLLKGDAPELCPVTMPLEIKGLDMKRQWYLYHSIHEYVSTEKQDIVCPLPEVSVSDNADSDSDLDVSTPPRKCACTSLGRGRCRRRGRRRGSEGKD